MEVMLPIFLNTSDMPLIQTLFPILLHVKIAPTRSWWACCSVISYSTVICSHGHQLGIYLVDWVSEKLAEINYCGHNMLSSLILNVHLQLSVSTYVWIIYLKKKKKNLITVRLHSKVSNEITAVTNSSKLSYSVYGSIKIQIVHILLQKFKLKYYPD